MDIDTLKSQVARLARESGGEFYTSSGLSDNPDVCNAACRWFAAKMPSMNLGAAIKSLENMNKDTLKMTQQNVNEGIDRIGEIVSAIKRDMGKLTQQELRISADAAAFVMNYWDMPANEAWHDSSTNSSVVGHVLGEIMADKNHKIMIYMAPEGNGSGHVICLTKIDDYIIYDPNLGITLLPDPITVVGTAAPCQMILNEILVWYRREMGLKRFGFKPIV